MQHHRDGNADHHLQRNRDDRIGNAVGEIYPEKRIRQHLRVVAQSDEDGRGNEAFGFEETQVDCVDDWQKNRPDRDQYSRRQERDEHTAFPLADSARPSSGRRGHAWQDTSRASSDLHDLWWHSVSPFP
ncbi:MAG TPA: hypothetical protein VL614_11300 [Acetobacteraceae bacterium]|nr:hypothetical protein [Acetobacteraceae bacterium]